MFAMFDTTSSFTFPTTFCTNNFHDNDNFYGIYFYYIRSVGVSLIIIVTEKRKMCQCQVEYAFLKKSKCQVLKKCVFI